MEWMKLIGDAIQYMEDHITQDLTADDVAATFHILSLYFQKGFAMMCGFSVSEYLRNRRLALAGNEVAATDEKIIDIALKYGYDSPDSFTKAFTRFHGATPTAVRRNGGTLKAFLPVKIKFTLEGGFMMDYRIEVKDSFQVIANAKTFSYEGAKQAIPAFWQEHYAAGKGKTICGTYGINIDESMGEDAFEYLIADPYRGQEIPEGFVVKTIPAFTWAVFPVKGAMPDALQYTNTMIYTEWLPAAGDYEFAAGYCVEMYDDPCRYPKGTADENYYCEIWIPVRKK